MNEILNWRDLQLFFAVANAGGLAGAVKATGLSAPTLGRHMTALEQAVGCSLFVRHKNGYELTADAKELLSHVRSMQEASTGISRWHEQRASEPVIKITAGTWTSRFMAQRLFELGSGARVRLIPDSHFFDLRKREAHLAIRNRRPTQQGLAARKLGRVTFAFYGTPELTPAGTNRSIENLLEAVPLVTYEPAGAAVASSAWLANQLARQPVLSCATPTLVLDAALAGVGMCVLPCFVGDREPGLRRLSGLIPELEHIQWLVSHDEDRHLRHVRQIANSLHQMFASDKSLFEGNSPVSR